MIVLRKVLSSFFLLWMVVLFSGGCQTISPAISEESVAVLGIQITSSAFEQGGTIPQEYTCDGSDISPPLSWSGVPEETLTLVLIMDDPDAPMGTWVHWVLYDISPDQEGLPEGVSKVENVEGIGVQGRNDSRGIGYSGPCPPPGKPHGYNFKLYALDISLGFNPGATKSDVERAMQGHVLAQGILVGMYGR
ncbi:MAG: YbhB/YbcL family Raf kinase inhibitor-like protein [Chloroflexota bacterium]